MLLGYTDLKSNNTFNYVSPVLSDKDKQEHWKSILHNSPLITWYDLADIDSEDYTYRYIGVVDDTNYINIAITATISKNRDICKVIIEGSKNYNAASYFTTEASQKTVDNQITLMFDDYFKYITK